MTLPQYQADQKQAVAAAVAVAAMTAALAGVTLATPAAWLQFLKTIWPLIVRARFSSAWSARQFFDTERRRVTGLPDVDVPLIPEYRFDWFVNDLKPAFVAVQARVAAVQEQTRQGIPARLEVETPVRVAVAKTVQDAGRDQMIQAVDTDNLADVITDVVDLDAPKKPKRKVRWARKATGEETCGWCWMLVSRGPVYGDADNAGLDAVDETDALEILKAGNVQEHLTQWHLGCDCIVVPVFDRADWPGMEDQATAEEDWKKASKAANQIIDLISEGGEYERLRYKAAKRDRKGDLLRTDKGGMVYRNTYLGLGKARSREAVNAMRILQTQGPEGLERWLQRRLDKERRLLEKAS